MFRIGEITFSVAVDGLLPLTIAPPECRQQENIRDSDENENKQEYLSRGDWHAGASFEKVWIVVADRGDFLYGVMALISLDLGNRWDRMG